MPIRPLLLKKWVGPDPEKHIGSTPLMAGQCLTAVCGSGVVEVLSGCCGRPQDQRPTEVAACAWVLNHSDQNNN